MAEIDPLVLPLEVTGKGASAAHEVWAVLCRIHPAIEALGHDPDSGMWLSEKIARACAISKGTRWRGLQKLLADGYIYSARPLIPTKYHRNGVGYAFTNPRRPQVSLAAAAARAPRHPGRAPGQPKREDGPAGWHAEHAKRAMAGGNPLRLTCRWQNRNRAEVP